MPFYRFTIPAGSPSAGRKADIAMAVTKVHTEVTGAPPRYVNVSFTKVPSGSLFVAGEPVTSGRMVGIIRDGRTPGVQEVPGSHVMEDGEILPEASDD